jgi:hypothetical protein
MHVVLEFLQLNIGVSRELDVKFLFQRDQTLVLITESPEMILLTKILLFVLLLEDSTLLSKLDKSEALTLVKP